MDATETPESPANLERVSSKDVSDPSASGSPLIVLDERKLDAPLEESIKALQKQNPGARILIVGPEDGGPGEGGADEGGADEGSALSSAAILEPKPSVRPKFGMTEPSVLGKVDAAIAMVGADWQQSDEILARWVGEAKRLIDGMQEELAQDNVAALAKRLDSIHELMGWIHEALGDSLYRAGKASKGMQVLNPAALLRDAARSLHRRRPGIRLQLPKLQPCPSVTGRAGTLQQAFQIAIEGVAASLHGRGDLRIEVEEGNLFILHRFVGIPDAEDGRQAEFSPHLLHRLTYLIEILHGGKIFSESSDGKGLVLAVSKRNTEEYLARRGRPKPG